jgi:integrase
VKGNITRRGKTSWRIKFDVGTDDKGARRIRYSTVRGKRADAERELTRLLNSHHEGTLVEPSKITVADYIRDWLDKAALSPKTLERYRELAELQIIPHLGNTVLQKLRPRHISDWHTALLASGSKGGKPLAARTVGHAHRVLHGALARACAVEVLSRNVAAIIPPPKVEDKEVEILSPDQITTLVNGLAVDRRRNQTLPVRPLVFLALATGLRRGELLGLQWGDIDMDKATLKVDRSVEETKAGLRLKAPKTKNGRRTISLPASAIDALKVHRASLRADRLLLGVGREANDTLVFSTDAGDLLSPDGLSKSWRYLTDALDLPPVMFHALRHTHASALIAAGLDVVTVSRRLGHANPTVTLNVYSHLFRKTDQAAAVAIEAALKG